MRDRQTSGFYNSVTLSSAGLPPGRRATGAYMPPVPQRRGLMGLFRIPGDGETLPSLEEGRRYVRFWSVFGVVLATLLAVGWSLLSNTNGFSLQHFPWAMWSVTVLLCFGYAVWNMWYLKQVVTTSRQQQHMVWQEKHAQSLSREKIFEQIMVTASNAEPLQTAARVNAILRIPDLILSRGHEGSYFRVVGCGLLGAILMEVNTLERESELGSRHEMIKRVTFKSLMSVKEHLNGISLQSVNLSGLDLSFANLSGTDLTGSYLAEADLEEANLQSATLEYCELQKVNLSSSELQGANLEHAIFFEANLSSARLRGANAQYANFQQANMENAELTEAHFRGANLQNVNLQGAQLRFTDLRDANLQNADLQGADLEGADLEGADLQGANLNGARTQGANIPSS